MLKTPIAEQFQSIFFASDAFVYLVDEMLKAHPQLERAPDWSTMHAWCQSQGLDLGAHPDCTRTCWQVLHEGAKSIWPEHGRRRHA